FVLCDRRIHDDGQAPGSVIRERELQPDELLVTRPAAAVALWSAGVENDVALDDVAVREAHPSSAHIDGARAEEHAGAGALEPLAHETREALARDCEIARIDTALPPREPHELLRPAVGHERHHQAAGLCVE